LKKHRQLRRRLLQSESSNPTPTFWLNCWILIVCGASIASADGGPRLDDAELFRSIDLDRPALSEVQRAAQRGDLDSAKHAFTRYLRGREEVHWWFDPRAIDRNVKHDRKKADDAVKGRVRIRYEYTFPDGKIDWRFNATKDRDDVAYTKEWQWQVNRMYFWPALGDTYWATGDERYAKAWVRQFRGWVQQNPFPAGGKDTCWRTIESGSRMGHYWPWTFHRFLSSPSVTDEDLIWYVRSCIEHGRQLRKDLPRGNWLMYSMNGLFTLGAVFPELKEATEWRRFALDTMAREITDQWYPDGVFAEYSASYHKGARGHILDIYDKAVAFGYGDELPNGFTRGIERTYEFDLFTRMPDGTMPQLNDSFRVRPDLKAASRRCPARDDYRWMDSGGKEGTPPSDVSHAFRHAGLFVMRSGWDDRAHCLLIDAAPLGTMHEHQDKLHLILWVYGREMLYDSGGGVYESSRWRRYGIDTFSHNTVLVDSQPQRRSAGKRADAFADKPVAARWESDERHDYLAATYDGPYATGDTDPARNAAQVHFPDQFEEVVSPATHTRRVYFLKPDIFVVQDLLISRDDHEHQYEAHWHLASTRTRHEDSSGTVTTIDEGKPNLAIVPLERAGLKVRAVSGQEEPEILGWRVKKGRVERSTTVTHTRSGKNAQFLTLLVPQRQGESLGIVRVDHAEAERVRVRLDDGRTLEIDAPRDPEDKLRVQWTE
jgi:hypothetical protein